MKRIINPPVKDQQIVVRCTDAEKTDLKRRARRVRATPSAFVRHILFGEIKNG